MSAKRRQEAIARFSVPVEGKSSDSSSSKLTRSIQNRGKGKAKMALVDGFEDDESDPDFMMPTNGFDEDFSEEDNPRVMLISLKAVSDLSQSSWCVSNLSVQGCSWLEFDW
jgi:hypothetical protein